MKKKTICRIIKLIILVTYLSVAISIERIYRDPLFDKSLTWEKEWQQVSGSFLSNFFKVITEFGSEAAFIPLLVIIHLWFPIIKSYSFLSSLIYSTYFNHLLKVIYGNPRPFWINPNLKKHCDGAYGNPSGHAFSSTVVYLSFWHIITDFQVFKKRLWGIILRVLLLILFILLIIVIMLSRIFLGVHSVNQILYGSSLGFALYFLIFHVLSVIRIDAQTFFQLFIKTFSIVIFSIVYTLLLIITFLVWGLVKHDTSELELTLNYICPDLNNYKLFNNDGLFGMLTLFAMIGAHYGISFLINLSLKKFPNNEKEINSWYKGCCPNQLYRILLFIVFVLPVLLIVAIPDDTSFEIIFIFKVSLPYLITLFNIYGPLIYCSLLLKIGNNEVWKMNNDNRIITYKNIHLQNVVQY